MSQILTAALPYFFAVLLLCSGLLTFAFSMFSLGAKEDMVQKHRAAGFLPSLAERFIGVYSYSLVLVLLIALISALFWRYHRPSSWTRPQPVLWRAAVVNLFCALGGCLLFVWHVIYG